MQSQNVVCLYILQTYIYIYMYMCVCVCVCSDWDSYECINFKKHIHIYKHIYQRTSAFSRARAHTHTHTYARTHKHIHKCMRTCGYTYIRTQTQTHMHMYIYIYICVCVCVCVYVCVCVPTILHFFLVCVCVCASQSECTQTHTHTHTHTHTNIYIYIYIYICMYACMYADTHFIVSLYISYRNAYSSTWLKLDDVAMLTFLRFDNFSMSPLLPPISSWLFVYKWLSESVKEVRISQPWKDKQFTNMFFYGTFFLLEISLFFSVIIDIPISFILYSTLSHTKLVFLLSFYFAF